MEPPRRAGCWLTPEQGTAPRGAYAGARGEQKHPQASIDWASAEVEGGDLTVALTGEPNAEWAKRVQSTVERLVRSGERLGHRRGEQDGRHGRGGRRRRGGGPAPPSRRRRPAGQRGLRTGGRRRRGRTLRGGQRDDRGLPSVRGRAARRRLTRAQAPATRSQQRSAPGAASSRSSALELALQGLGQPVLAPSARARAASPARRRSARRRRGGRRAGSGRRETSPASSSSRTVCAIDCGRIRSAAARSLTLAGPSRSSRPSTASCGDGRAGLRAQAADEPADVSRSSCASSRRRSPVPHARQCSHDRQATCTGYLYITPSAFARTRTATSGSRSPTRRSPCCWRRWTARSRSSRCPTSSAASTSTRWSPPTPSTCCG